MGCTNCKNKESIKKQVYDTTKNYDSGIVWFSIIWTALAIYGLYSLITKFI